jgi:hypothetical protein
VGRIEPLAGDWFSSAMRSPNGRQSILIAAVAIDPLRREELNFDTAKDNAIEFRHHRRGTI